MNFYKRLVQRSIQNENKTHVEGGLVSDFKGIVSEKFEY